MKRSFARINAQSAVLSRPIEDPSPRRGDCGGPSATRSLDSAELSRAKESATCAVERSLFSARSARFKRFLLFSPLRERRKPRAQATSRELGHSAVHRGVELWW